MSARANEPSAPSDRDSSTRDLGGLDRDLTPDQFQAIARALADPRRFAILQQIAANDYLMCSNLDAQTCISPATISHHLRELSEAGLIDARRDGRRMSLTLRRPTWNAYLRQLQQL